MLALTAHDLIKTRTCNSSSKDCMLRNCPECLKPGISLSDFKADLDFISFLQWQRLGKKIIKVNQTMPFCQVITRWAETVSFWENLIWFHFEYLQENCLLCDNQSVFDLQIHVSINYFLLSMIFMHLLIATHPKMWEGYFLIYLKPLIEYGMKGSSTKWNVLVWQVCL